MEDQARTYEELIKEISDLKQSITEREQSDSEFKRAEHLFHQEHELYLDLVNNQPAGIYRIRVYPRERWQQDAWTNPKHPPYSVDLASNRFCELLGIDRQVFETNPGIMEELIHPEDKADFSRRNEEANAQLVLFHWEGRLSVRGEIHWVHLESIPRRIENGVVLWTGILYDITERNKAEREREKLIAELQQALVEIKTLRGIVPICASCKKIRDDKGYWEQVESFVSKHTDAQFSHGICPDCTKKYFPSA